MNTIQEYWVNNQISNSPVAFFLPGFVLCERVVCKDGFTMSVQASEYHYCTPREVLKDGSYTNWEIMCNHDELLGEDESEDVYAYVPTETVNALIEKHGGFANQINTEGDTK